MFYKIFLQKNWLTLIITLSIIGFYLIFHFVIIKIFGDQPIITILFILLILLILFPVKDFLKKQQFSLLNWDYIQESEIHHIEFLSEFFTLEDIIYKVTPELMLWLRIEEARMFILNPDKKNFTMFYFNKGKIQNIHLILKTRLFYILKILKKYHKVLKYDDLDINEKKIMKKFNIFLVVPFFHLNRLMGFISFHQPVVNPYAEKALELYAIKFAFLIHDEILKKRIQNITKYEEEIRIAKKIHNMLQNFNPPKIPQIEIQISNFESSSIIEFFQVNGSYYIIILSTPSLSGISGMILSGKLGHLFAYLQEAKDEFKISGLLNELKNDGIIYHENYPVEILVIQILPQTKSMITYTQSSGYLLQSEKSKILRVIDKNQITLESNKNYSIVYRKNVVLEISFKGYKNEKVS